MHSRIPKFTATVRSFRRSSRGNVAMMFAIALIPLMIGAAAGLDFARGMLVRQQMSEALDAAALAVGSSTGLDQAHAQTLAQQYFNANFTVDTTAYGTPTVAIPPTGYNSTGSVQLTATDTMPTVLMKLAGITSLPISTTSTVVWGQTKLWVSLVLDNTGSMTQTDSTGTSKISALKTASHQLLTILQNAASNPGDVRVSIVPFSKLVKVGTGSVSASWIEWTDWSAQGAAEVPPSTTGPGDGCPYSYGCRSPGTNSSTGTIPSAAPTSGYICPWAYGSGKTDGTNGHYFMGCFTSTATGLKTQISSGRHASCNGYSSSNCSCSGTGTSTTCTTNTWTHTSWVPETDHSLWNGCIMDRAQNYDTNVTSPSGSSLYPAANDDYCPPAGVLTLGYDWTALSTEVDAMTANGSTNQTIGLQHGWATLTSGSPYSAPTLPANTTQYIILVSDGLNTQDRWYGDGSNQSTSVDGRMSTTCTNAKAAGIVIYTIFVDLNGTQGNSTVLQNCATDSSKYFDLTTSNAIITTFNQIAQQITAVRVSR
jgi:Flp pilus assembly protein TadG